MSVVCHVIFRCTQFQVSVLMLTAGFRSESLLVAGLEWRIKDITSFHAVVSFKLYIKTSDAMFKPLVLGVLSLYMYSVQD